MNNIKLTPYQLNLLIDNLKKVDRLKIEIGRINNENGNLIKFMLETKGVDSDKFEYEILPETSELKLIELKKDK